MKIALLCNEYPPHPHGGIGTFVQEFARALDGAGHQVYIFGLRDVAEEYSDNQIKIKIIGGRRIKGLSWLVRRLRFWLFVRRQVKIYGIDIIETTDFMGPLPFNVGCPVVVRLHLTSTAMAKQKDLKPHFSNLWFEQRQLRSHGAWIAMSRYALSLTKDTFHGVKPTRSAIIHPPVDPPSPASSIEGVPHNFVLYAGFVEKRKGALVVATAARQFLHDNPTLELVYAGAILSEDGQPVDEIVLDILGPDLSKRVKFLGWVDRPTVMALMRRARLLLFPSLLETFGLVVVEAMLQGCPVVVSDSGPFPEFVRDGETGLLIDPEDPEALATAAARILNDQSFAQALGQRGKAYVTDFFSREKHLRETLDYYGAVLNTSPHRRRRNATLARIS